MLDIFKRRLKVSTNFIIKTLTVYVKMDFMFTLKGT